MKNPPGTRPRAPSSFLVQKWNIPRARARPWRCGDSMGDSGPCIGTILQPGLHATMALIPTPSFDFAQTCTVTQVYKGNIGPLTLYGLCPMSSMPGYP
jgi:hypothetical protein